MQKTMLFESIVGSWSLSAFAIFFPFKLMMNIYSLEIKHRQEEIPVVLKSNNMLFYIIQKSNINDFINIIGYTESNLTELELIENISLCLKINTVDIKKIKKINKNICFFI